MNQINLADETAEELSADEVAIICSFLPPKDIMRARVCLTGNIYSLRVLKDALEMVHIDQCRHIKGHLMDLADFPNLKELVLNIDLVNYSRKGVGIETHKSDRRYPGHPRTPFLCSREPLPPNERPWCYRL